MEDLSKIIEAKLSKERYEDGDLDRDTLDAVYAAIPGNYDAINYQELLTGIKNG